MSFGNGNSIITKNAIYSDLKRVNGINTYVLLLYFKVKETLFLASDEPPT